jgi:MFS family permease
VRPARVDARRALVALAALAVLLAAADAYVVVLALPDIMAGVGVGLDELQRATPIVSGFLLGYVACLPLIGRLSDLYGRTPVLVGALAVFAFGSLLTASAHGLALVVAGRALQGVGGGGLVPVTLALVADRWPPERRGLPLGAVGAAQEVGSVLGPLYGGAVLAVASWRVVFWVNLAVAVLLAVLVVCAAAVGRRSGPGRQPGRQPGRRRSVRLGSGVAGVLALTGLVLLLTAPAALTSSVRLGAVYVPLLAGAGWSSPLALLTVALTAAWLAVVARPAAVGRLIGAADVLGAGLLGLALAGLVLAFAAADPTRQAVADQAPLLLAGTAACLVLFAIRQRRAPHPLVPGAAVAPAAAWGALAVNLFVGAALVAALVDVPIFARATRYPHSQLGAALVLVELLVALPVGALLGGALCHRVPPRWIAAAGMGLSTLGFAGMTTWGPQVLDGPASTVALVTTGLGFGLAIAPVNAALLAATDAAVHGVASALAVVARMVGMLVGLSVLTAVGLRIFAAEQARIGSPLVLCPRTPGDCPAYRAATRTALLSELHAIFWGAAACAAVAAVLAAVLLRAPQGPAGHRSGRSLRGKAPQPLLTRPADRSSAALRRCHGPATP